VNFSDAASLIKETLPISQLIRESGVELTKKGGEWIARCPFHEEKTPSFSVNDAKGLYYCRGNCGAKGDVITYFSQTNGVEPGDAIVMLSRRLGIPLNERSSKPKTKAVSDDYRNDLLKLHTLLAEHAHQNLINLLSDPDHPVTHYLNERGLTLETISAHRLGFIPADTPFSDVLKDIGPHLFTHDQLIRMSQISGLVYNGNARSPFQNRLLFPIHEKQGSVCAFSGRTIPKLEPLTNDNGQKYRNSPDTPLFDKSQTLYGVTPNTHAVQSKAIAMRWRKVLNRQVCYLVEGYTDVIAMQSAGFMAVAAMGTSVTEHQIRQILLRYPKIIVLMDGDKAGKAALRKTLLVAFPKLRAGQRMQGVLLNPGTDPDTVIQECNNDRSLIRNHLSQCLRVTPENVWLNHEIGKHDKPASVGDQVLIEQALLKDTAPTDPAYRLSLLSYIEAQTSYMPGSSSGPRINRSAWHAIDLSEYETARYWLIRFSRAPQAIKQAMYPFRRTWWYRDATSGLLSAHAELPPSIRLLILADHCLSAAQAEHEKLVNWDALIAALMSSGFPTLLIERWHSVIFQYEHNSETPYHKEPIAIDLWQSEWTEMMQKLATNMNDRLYQALND
jgi:DNA primase catalytic core